VIRKEKEIWFLDTAKNLSVAYCLVLSVRGCERAESTTADRPSQVK
jgi:hypothetical protein